MAAMPAAGVPIGQAVAAQAAGAAPAGGPGAAPATGGVVHQHSRRLVATRVAGSTLWSLLGSGLVQWEVAHRSSEAAPAAEADAAHWRALQSLTQLALAAGTTGASQLAASQVLLEMVGGGRPPAQLLSGPPNVTAALLPSLLQLQQPPLDTAYPSEQDPMSLLLQLLAALLTRPADMLDPSLTCSAHTQPAAVLQALLTVLYPAAAGQALCLAIGGGCALGDAVSAMAGSPPLASAVEGSVSSQLLPWLQRAALLSALLAGTPAPAPAETGTSAGAALSALLQRLHLPPLAEALQSAAAASLPASPPVPGLPGPPGVQFSISAAGRHWTVVNRPPPVAAQLLQLPASFQAWYLSMGSQRCSACSQPPAEPALCMRCGAVVCCGGRRCHGPGQQGMAFTHSLACGGGTCVFLLLKMTRLLVLRKNRATFLASPYVDSHGEEDLRLQRGKPLSLHTERLRRLWQLWRSAAFDFDSTVLHAANHRNELASMY